MSKIIISGTVFTIESSHTLADLEKVANYKPDALALANEAKEKYFFVLPGAFGTVSNDGVTFADEAPDGSGKAVVTIPLPATGGDAKKAIAAKYGPTIVNMNKVEAQIAEALAEVDGMLASVEEQITVAGATEIPAPDPAGNPGW